MKQLDIRTVVTCEYVGLGAYGKHTLVNVYTGDILVQEYPATFPLSWYIEIMPEKSTPPELDFELLENGKLKGKLRTGFAFERDRMALLVIPQITFAINEATEIRIEASGEGIERTTVLVRTVTTGPIPA